MGGNSSDNNTHDLVRFASLLPSAIVRCGRHRDRAPQLLLPGSAHDLQSLGFCKLRRKTEQGPVMWGIGQLALHQLGEGPIAAQAEVHLGAILAADVVQASFKAAGVAEEVGLLGEHHRNAAFASLWGVSPLPASSGKTNRHRLNRGGNRQANATLHRIVVVRLRCLKRFIAREELHTLLGRLPVKNAAA